MAATVQNTLKVSEDAYAEQPALEWLTANGQWDYVHGPEIAPGAAAQERTHWSDVVLIDRLKSAIRRLNPELPEEAVVRASELVLTTSSPEVILDHRDFHELLLTGVPVSFVDGQGVEQHRRAKIVDFDNPDNNEFLAVNQFRIVIGGKNRRPDILLFVNGMPLGQIELKNPADEHATPESAVNQVAHYKQTIPKLYRFVEIVGVSDGLEARVGTITTPAEHFAEWKSMDDEITANTNPLQLMIEGAFAPATFLDLIHNFVLFETSGSKTTKIMAKYHQHDAVNRAIEATADAMSDDQRAGVVWHTQGSGKSYTMAFYVTKMRRDPRFANPTVVALTDRNDLDEQLFKGFGKLPNLAEATRRAERIQGGSDGLFEMLDRPSGGIIFTTIQKFTAGKGEVMPVLSERTNIVVMADEAHRSEYGKFAQNITAALPNATRIGFTGTPIETADKSTRSTFGDFISVYRMGQAQRDRATVPIFYESRQIPVDVADPAAIFEVEEVLETEEAEAATKLVTAWAKLEKIVGADDRLDKVAEDIVAHYTARSKSMEGKAMVVAYSRRIAAELTERLKKSLGENAVTCVMTAQATDDPLLSQYRRNKRDMRELEDQFKDADSDLRVVVVRDMWLTGFDVPSLHTLYIDKPMKDHGLLQAIARVNRVFRDKPGGLVVDYIGIGDDLRASLTAYSKDDIDDVAVPLSVAVSKLKEKHEVLCDQLHGIGFRPADDATAAQRLDVLSKAVKAGTDRFIDDDEKKVLFLDEQVQFERWYKRVSPAPEAVQRAYDRDVFRMIAATLRSLTAKAGEASKEAQQAVKQFFSEGLAAGEVVDVFALAGEDRPEISVLSDEFLDQIQAMPEKNLQVALIEKLLKGQVRARLRSNALQAKQFSEQIDAVLNRYRNNLITSAEVVQALVELAKKLRESKHRHEEMGLSEEEAAFYDALAGNSDAWQADPKLKKIAADLVKAIKEDLTVDWCDREQAEAAMRRKVKRFLRRSGYTPPADATSNGGGGGSSPLDFATQMVLAQARALYRYWPDDTGDALFIDRVIAGHELA